MEPLKKVLIGYDGSPASTVAIEDLKRAGLPKRLDAVVLSAADVMVFDTADASLSFPGPMPTVARVAATRSKEARQEAVDIALWHAKAGAQLVRDLFPLWKVVPEVRTESPAWAIIQKADEWDADLIVVGAGRSAAYSRFLGSISQLVVINATQPVRVSREPIRKGDENLRIIIGMDGSADAVRAFEAVEKREWPASTQVRIVSSMFHRAMPQLTHLMPPDLHLSTTLAAERDDVTRMLTYYAERLQRKLPLSTIHVADRAAKHLLVEEADCWQADCIFVGARGLGAVKRFLLGSVSAAVSARAQCSVEVAR